MILNFKIKKLRINAKKTQKNVSDYLGVSQAVYSRYESGKNNPSLDSLDKLAEYYDVPLIYFFSKDFDNDIEDNIELVRYFLKRKKLFLSRIQKYFSDSVSDDFLVQHVAEIYLDDATAIYNDLIASEIELSAIFKLKAMEHYIESEKAKLSAK